MRALVTVSILLSIAAGEFNSPCTFPQKMEGNVELYHAGSLFTWFYDGARFAVDYKDKMSAIILHPTNDEIYIRQDFRKVKKYHKHEDGSCRELPLLHNETFYKGIPSYAYKTTFDPTLSGDLALTFEFWDRDAWTYAVVLKANCVPKLIERYAFNYSKTITERYMNVKTSISDPSILDKKC